MAARGCRRVEVVGRDGAPCRARRLVRDVAGFAPHVQKPPDLPITGHRWSGLLGGRRSGKVEPARWATPRDVRTLVVDAPRAGHVTIGSVRRRVVAAEAGHSVLVVGPTQSRQDDRVGHSRPCWSGRARSSPPRSRPIWPTTPSGGARRRGRRRVRPARRHRPRPARPGRPWRRRRPGPTPGVWRGRSPRSPASTPARSPTAVSGTRSPPSCWPRTCWRRRAPGRTMADVVRWLDEHAVDEVVDALAGPGDDRSAGGAGVAGHWGRDDRQRSGVYTTAETVVEVFADPVVAATESPFPGGAGGPCDRPRTIARRERRPRSTYVRPPMTSVACGRCSPPSWPGSSRPPMTGRPGRQGAPLDPPLLVVLDEAANIAPLAELDMLASTAAGHGVQLVTVWQDLAQLHARYGARAAPSVVNNHRAKVFLSGIADPGTLEHASALIGEASGDLGHDRRRPRRRRRAPTRPPCSPVAGRRPASDPSRRGRAGPRAPAPSGAAAPMARRPGPPGPGRDAGRAMASPPWYRCDRQNGGRMSEQTEPADGRTWLEGRRFRRSAECTVARRRRCPGRGRRRGDAGLRPVRPGFGRGSVRRLCGAARRRTRASEPARDSGCSPPPDCSPCCGTSARAATPAIWTRRAFRGAERPTGHWRRGPRRCWPRWPRSCSETRPTTPACAAWCRRPSRRGGGGACGPAWRRSATSFSTTRWSAARSTSWPTSPTPAGADHRRDARRARRGPRAVRVWSHALARGLDPDFLLPPEAVQQRLGAILSFVQYFASLIEERRQKPGDDLLPG